MPTIEELQAQLAESKAANATLLKDAADRAIDALFAECGEKPTDAERAEFVSMPPASFAAAAAQMRKLSAKTKKLDPKLFQEQATSDVGGDADRSLSARLSAESIYSRRAMEARAVVLGD